jgi:uncharacterized delta-60 repeat protein
MRILSILSKLAGTAFLIAAFTSALRSESQPGLFCVSGSMPRPETSGIAAFSAPLPPADSLSEPVQIDLMVLYTPAALAAAGGAEILENQIQRALADANYRYTNSAVNIHLNLVHQGLINYPESGNIATDWNLLAGYAGPRGSLDRAALLRESFKADLVFMITETDSLGADGVADIATATGNVNHAYGIVRRRSLASPVVFAHEIGHTLGGQHDREHATDPSGKVYPGAFPYSFGYHLESHGAVYVTIMAYPPGLYLPYFSNPRLQFEGVPLGIAAGQPGASDNARTFNQVAPYVARYRTAASRIAFTDARIEVSESSGAITLRLNRSGDLSQPGSAVLNWEADSSARAGADYQKPASSVVSFPAGASVAEIMIPLLQNAKATGDRTIHLTLASPSGQNGLGWQASTLAVIRKVEPSILFDGPVTYARESDGEVGIPVTFNGGFNGSDHADILARLDPSPGSAQAGADFLFEDHIITFTPARLRETLRIPILDHGPGPDRSFHLFVGNTRHEVRILDSERIGSFQPVADSLAHFLPALMLGSPDGKILLAGQSTEQEEKKTILMRLNSSGSLDARFHSPEFQIAEPQLGGLEAEIRVLAFQPDGRILAGGGFSKVDGQARSGLVRLNPDGTVDASFVPGVIKGSLRALAVEPGGRILIGGIFDQVSGEPRNGLACLEPDGSLSSRFAETPRLASQNLLNLEAISLDDQGRIFLGGFFDKVNGQPLTNLVCITPEGEIDSGFNLHGGASGPVAKIRSLPDGKWMVSGSFDRIGKVEVKTIARLNADGSVDAAFRPNPAPNGAVDDFLPLRDGRVIIAGSFTKVSSASSPYLALVDKQGMAVTDFDLGSGPGGYCYGLAAGGNHSLFLLGNFDTFNHLPAHGLARIKFDFAPRLSVSTQPDHYVPPGNRWWYLKISGHPAGVYEVQASEDLAAWRTLDRIALSAETLEIPFQFLDPEPDHQFVRLKSVP